MTKFGESAIIINGRVLFVPSTGNTITIEIKMEENADERGKLVCLYSKCENTCQDNKKKMESKKMNGNTNIGDKLPVSECEEIKESEVENPCVNLDTIPLRAAMNYFVKLFYKTEKRYSCTRTKIGKLLSILAFKYARSGRILFNETISKYPPSCGTKIKDLDFMIIKTVYMRDLNNDCDKNRAIDVNEYSEDAFVPSEFTGCEGLGEDIAKEIKNIFYRFGAYPGDALGQLLNPIADRLVINDNMLNLSEMSSISKTAFCSDDNEIINYLYQN